jgi:hypothetical protein
VQQAKRRKTIGTYASGEGESQSAAPQELKADAMPADTLLPLAVVIDEYTSDRHDSNGYQGVDNAPDIRSCNNLRTIPDALSEPGHKDGKGISHRTPGRSKSLQPTCDSPHNTGLFSSWTSPHDGRAKSDLFCNGLSQNSPKAARTGCFLPVDIEAPGMKKKRGRTKKQVVGQEAGEINKHVEEMDDLGKPPNKHRPEHPKREQVGDVDGDQDTLPYATVTHIRQSQTAGILAKQYAAQDSKEDIDKIHQSGHIQSKPEGHSEVRLPREQPHTHPPKMTGELGKEPKRKKLKRGKTTSIIMKKSHESEVEDDVLWIVDEPPNDRLNDGSKSALNLGSNEGDIATLEPKKRGRKRKKTAEADNVIVMPTEGGHSQDSPDVLQDISNHTTNPSNSSYEKNCLPPGTGTDNRPEQMRTPDASPDPLTETPKKQAAGIAGESSTTLGGPRKGPDKHSPIARTSKVPFRVGLSRKARIAPLLKVVRK